ncbi:LacI family DNA-binding transcriptional regulator [Marispirochaeta sp.]|uniref:LacI family DNA-binding transcriptional regulator n=1 Tax=Marispirochaeta sp. TaxID=2038653 RepID=UPI0029C6D183|nr:LacI family DNA-binding transcriptional regulator [Marispirochaeta sp.]
MASQHDVAKMANVSLMTVSRVVNGDPRVKLETREKVQHAIEVLGYYPNAMARALNSKKTMTIGMILPKIDYVLSEPYFTQLIYNIEKTLGPHNYDLLIGSEEHQNGRDLTLLYKHKKVDGLIIIGAETNDERLIALSENRIPAVLIHSRSELPGLSFVDVDNFKLIEYFVDRLYGLGHRRIGLITGDLTVINAYHRLLGYKESLKKRDIPFSEELLFPGDWSSYSGYEACIYFQSLAERRPTAIISSNDHMAVGFIKSAYEHNIKIPEDLSIVGVDDIEMASFTTPKITTMRQPMHTIANLAVKLLLDSIDAEKPKESHIILEAEAVIRESCGPVPVY